MKADQILTVLNQFKNSSYQKILIDGSWGIGKTKYVADFKKEYTNCCYISLFGKKDIDSIVQEIYFRIIEITPLGNIKKHSSLLREKLNSVNIRFAGFSLSIPVIEDIHNSLNKELDKKETFIIILDDLERKHNDLGIEEILGLLDSLSKITNIKTVLVAATDQLKDENSKRFKEYKEKAIDRVYTVDHYAEEAPKNILGNEVWSVIGGLVENLKFKNLRTFEKANSFIKEVVSILGDEVFTNKFTKDDVYRICFATVFYDIEHKNEMRLLSNEGDRDKLINVHYTSGVDGEIDYLCNYILKNSLDNAMSKTVFAHIKNWFKKGISSLDHIRKSIDAINNYEHKPRNFYSSEQEVLEIIEYSREYIKNLDGTEEIETIVSTLSTAFVWTEVLSVDFGISNEEIITLAKDNISNSIDIQKGIHENELTSWQFSVESKNAEIFINSINEVIQTEYYDQLTKKINQCFINESYDNYYYLRQLKESVFRITDSRIRESTLNTIKDNDFFFPLPSGKITEEHWNWCSLVKLLVKEIEQYWNLNGLYEEFKNHNYDRQSSQKDKMLKHRLNVLFDRTDK